MNLKCLDYLEGLLTPEEIRNFEEELSKDPTLVQLLNEYKELLESEKLLRSTSWTTPHGFESRLYSKVAGEGQSNSVSTFKRFFRLFEYCANPRQMGEGILATVFLVSFSILLTRKIPTNTEPLSGLTNRESHLSNSATNSPVKASTSSPTPYEATINSVVPTQEIQDEDSEPEKIIELKEEPSVASHRAEGTRAKKARSVPHTQSRSLQPEENSIQSNPNSATESMIAGGAPPGEVEDEVVSDSNPPTAQSAPEAFINDAESSDTSRRKMLKEDNLLSAPSSADADEKCQTEHVVITLEASQRIFDRPSLDAKVTYTNPKPVKAIVCKKVGGWVGLQYLEGKLCPWAQEGSKCPIGWITLPNLR